MLGSSSQTRGCRSTARATSSNRRTSTTSRDDRRPGCAPTAATPSSNVPVRRPTSQERSARSAPWWSAVVAGCSRHRRIRADTSSGRHWRHICHGPTVSSSRWDRWARHSRCPPVRRHRRNARPRSAGWSDNDPGMIAPCK